MAVPKTSISAGLVLRAALLADEEVAKRTRKIFPIVTDSAELPYILYRRTSVESFPQKSGKPGADETQVEVLCYTSRYAEGVELAEAVRAALDYMTCEYNGINVRSCLFIGSEEGWEDDAFVQQLVFSVKI